jgi:hypothetical protein
VLDEVSETALVVVLVDGARRDDETQLGASLRTTVRANEVAEPVVEHALHDVVVDRQRARVVVGFGEGGRRGCEAGRDEESARGREECDPTDGARRPGLRERTESLEREARDSRVP